MPRRELLSGGQREDLLALPADEAEFIRRYSLATEDRTRIGRFNKLHNRLGFAVLLCYLRYPGQELGPGAKPDGGLCARRGARKSARKVVQFFPFGEVTPDTL